MIKVHYLRVLAAIGIIFLAACTESSSSSSSDSDLAVTAKDDFTVDEGDTGVELSIKSSDGSISTYAWTQVGADDIDISNSNAAKASFTAPSDLAAVTELTFRITVSNSSGSKSDDVVVTVNNSDLPAVTAAANFDVNESETGVSLSFSSSGGISSYSWEQVNVDEEYNITINNSTSASAASASFDAPSNLVDGDVLLTFEVFVTDDDDNNDTDRVTVTINDLDIPTIYDVFVSSDNVVNTNDQFEDDGMTVDNYATVSYSGKTSGIYTSSATQIITLVIGGTIEIEATVGSDGDFGGSDLNLASLAQGSHSLVATYYDDDGAVVAEFADTVTMDTEFSSTIDSVTVAAGTYKVGDEITVTISDDKNQTGLSLVDGSTFNNEKLSGFVDNGDGTYAATYTVVEGNTDADASSAAHTIPFNLTLRDSSGNPGDTNSSGIELASGDTSVSIDANTPVITEVSIADGNYSVGYDVVVNITADVEAGLELVEGSTFNGQTLNVNDFTDNSGGSYAAMYTVAAGDSSVGIDGENGNVVTNIALKDAAGNISDAVTLVGVDASKSSINANTDSVSIYDVVVNDNNYIKNGDQVTSVKVSGSTYGIESGQPVTIYLDVGSGVNAILVDPDTADSDPSDDESLVKVASNGTFSITVDLSSYTSSNLVASSNAFTEGDYDLNASVSNKNGSVATFESAFVVDTSLPDVGVVTLDDVAMGVGEHTVNIAYNTSADSGITLDGSATNTVAGYNITDFSGSGTTYTASFTIEEGDDNYASGADVAVAVTLLDAAGNSKASSTVSITLSGNQLIDAVFPVVVVDRNDTGNLTEGSGTLEFDAEGSSDVGSDDVNNTTDGDLTTAGSTFTWTQTENDGSALLATSAVGSLNATNKLTVTFTAPIIEDEDATSVDFHYILTIKDKAGNETNSSVQTITVTNAYTIPAITASSEGAPDFDQITLSWSESGDLDYTLYRSTNDASVCQYVGGGLITKDGTSTACDNSAVYTKSSDPAISIDEETDMASFVDTNLEFHTTYHYWLEANLSSSTKVVFLSSEQNVTTSGPGLNDTGVVAGADYPSGFDSLSDNFLTCDGGYLVDENGNATGSTETGTFVEFVGEDCEFGRDFTDNSDEDGHAGFSFTKIGDNGEMLSADATEWSCVLDNVTGLVWEVKTDDGTLRDKDQRFAWYDEDGASGSTSIGGTSSVAGVEDTQDLVAYANGENSGKSNLCTLSGWRLPTAGELLSITNYSVVADTDTAAVDSNYFPNMQGYKKLYWTGTFNQTTAASVASGATNNGAVWAYNNGSLLLDAFDVNGNGGAYNGTNGATSGYAILVNSSIDADGNSNLNDWSTATRYTINIEEGGTKQDGTVTDNLTRLMWMRCVYDDEIDFYEYEVASADGGDDDADTLDNCDRTNQYGDDGKAFYYEAFAEVESANDGNNNLGYTDWRLPNVHELYSLLNHSASVTARVNEDVFPDFRTQSFWASTPDASGGEAYYVNFSATEDSGVTYLYSSAPTAVGTVGMNGDTKNSIILVRDVD